MALELDKAVGAQQLATDDGNRSQGAMLIVTMGVLVLLAVLGTTFVSLMRLEKQATRNYIDAQVVDLINDSALERVISDLRGGINHLSYVSYARTPWIYKLRTREDDLAHGLLPLEDPRVGQWDILAREEERVQRSKTKIIDCAAQININGKQDTLHRMLDNLARAITSSPRLKKGSQNPLYSGPRQSGRKLFGRAILEYRNRLEGGKFRTKSQLKELIGEENYETIKDFITVHSWVDPFTYKSDDGIEEVRDLQQGVTTSGGGGGRVLGGGGRSISHPEVRGLAARLSPEPRSPVNINTAPEEVLIACLMGVGGRRPFPYSDLAPLVPIDQAATIEGQRVVGSEEIDSPGRPLLPRGVWVYTPRLEFDNAKQIAVRIIQERKKPGSQFMTWSSGQASRPGFAEFINQLEESFFPPITRAEVIDPGNPRDRSIRGQVMGGASDVSVLWKKGHNPRERSFRIQAGLPFHNQNAFYYETIKAAIIANANPNSRISRYNPNQPAYTPVDKSDLVVLDQDRQTPRYGHTTEFCFDSMGVFEVTTLGEIARRKPESADGSTYVSSSSRRRSVADEFEPLYRKKRRTVVKVFDVLRHTNQLHFERTFRSGSFSSDNDRRYVLTWPDNVTALTDVVSLGSMRDGRVELAGFKDGLRLEMPPGSRQQAYRSPETLLMAHGFQDRDDRSYSQLRSLSSRGAVGNIEYVRRLQEIFDANYSQQGDIMRRYYRRETMVTSFGGQVALNLDPRLEVDARGSNLRPDGFHSSLFTTGHLGGQFLHLPAHRLIGQGFPGRVGTGTMVGAGARTNVSGNVAYYNGGIAFWVKFEFNGDDPVFSGLVACTQVIEDVARTPGQYDGSEGTQFYVFKNTKGELRVVRMYYHEAYPATAIGGGGGDASEGSLTPVPHLSDLVGESGSNEQVQRYLDPKKPLARSDVIFSVRHFRAHEWHHIAVDWNDTNIGKPVQVFIDFQPIQGGGPFIPQAEIGNLPTAWVRLNQRRPMDGLFVGGFIRHQRAPDGGLFKFYTNTFTDSAGRGIRPIEAEVKRILANATIDELVTYTGSFQSVKRYFSPSGAPGYFTNQTGIYTNVMEIPMPPEVDHVIMRSLDWTSYYPSFFWGDINTRSPSQLRVQNIRCKVVLGRSSPSAFDEPWRRPNVINNIANRPALRPQAKGLIGRNAELVYQFQIPPAVAQTGQLAGGSVQTPVVDDVTATYYLPDAKILYQEEVD